MAADASQELTVEAEGVRLKGNLGVPDEPAGLVVFAHGSGSSRESPRNQYVAATLRDSGFATLLFDLLTEEEEVADDRDARFRFDIALLARRLVGVTDWIDSEEGIGGLRLGYFGASTGAAAALIAAAERASRVSAVVSRGGRPDLAGTALAQVQAPTLLIVGGNDEPVIGFNQTALGQIEAEKHLEIVPGATHLFDEPGTLERVAELASGWFTQHLANQR